MLGSFGKQKGEADPTPRALLILVPRTAIRRVSEVHIQLRRASAPQSMDWRTLWLMLLALATASAYDLNTVSVHVQASNNSKWYVGGSGEVSCYADDVDARDLSLHLSGDTLATEIVNNTVRYTNPNATESVQSEYVCHLEKYVMASVKVKVIAVLNVTDLTCRFDDRDKLNCSFSRVDGEQFYGQAKYKLSVGSGVAVSQCTAGQDNAARMHCMLQTTGYAHDLDTQTFNLTMIIDGEMQTQSFELPRDNLYVPKWPSSKPNVTSVDENRTCVSWENAQELLEWDLDWAVELRPHMPGIPPLNHTLPGGKKSDLRYLTFCFPHPPQGSQVFDVRLKCRIKRNNTIWSDYLPEFQITTSPTVPARPPQFLPDGFSFDKENDELTVFWFPLDKIYHNGPKLSYDVFWNGQEARHTYSHFATFKNWDVSQPANVTVRSRNSKGASTDSSWLSVPAINDVAKRRATHLRYHHADNSTTITWNKPENTDLLLGYTIYWCDASVTLGQFCKDGSSMNNISLNDGELQKYNFNRLMPLQDLALRPNFKDHVSGGISVNLVAVENKEIEEFTLRKARILEGVGALLVLGLVIISAKKLRRMNDIKVVLPYMGHRSMPEPKPEPEAKPSPRIGVPSTTIVSLELQPIASGEQEREPEEEAINIVALTEPESSSYVRMDSNTPIGRPPSQRINLNSSGYVMPSPGQMNLNNNGYVMESAPRLIPNNDGYINPPAPPQLNPNNNGYVMAPPPRSIPNDNGYVNPPAPRLIPNNDGYINPPPPQR